MKALQSDSVLSHACQIGGGRGCASFAAVSVFKIQLVALALFAQAEWMDVAFAQEKFTAAAPTSTPKCPPLQPPAVSFPGWDDDTNYDLVETEVAGGKKIRVVGDLLRISSDDFGSIIRDVHEAPANVREIEFDAREIRLEAPLSFTSATLTLRRR